MLKIIDGIEACAQDTKTRVGLVRGENPFDTTEGADYFNTMLSKMGGVEYVREEIRKRIQANTEVLGIKTLAIETDSNARTMTVTADVATIYGDTTI